MLSAGSSRRDAERVLEFGCDFLLVPSPSPSPSPTLPSCFQCLIKCRVGSCQRNILTHPQRTTQAEAAGSETLAAASLFACPKWTIQDPSPWRAHATSKLSKLNTFDTLQNDNLTSIMLLNTSEPRGDAPSGDRPTSPAVDVLLMSSDHPAMITQLCPIANEPQ